MVVYTLGPIKSRPFTMAVHSVIGIGFLAATFLVKPFLPEENSSRYKRRYKEISEKNNIVCLILVFFKCLKEDQYFVKTF